MSHQKHSKAIWRRWMGFALGVGSVTLLGALLRFRGLGWRDFWFDESCTFIYVHGLFDWPDLGHLLRESTNLPYYFLLRGWVAMFGDSEAAYRSLSALAATLTIPLLAATAWRLSGAWAAVFAAALAAVNPLHVHYAHEARAYALWVLVLSGALWVLLEAMHRGRRRWWVGFAALMGLGLYLHYFTVFALAASGFAVGLARDRGKALRGWFLAALGAVLVFVPYVVVAVLPAMGQGGREWLAEDTAWHCVLRSLWAFLPAGVYPEHLRGLSTASVDTVATGGSQVVWVTEWLPAVGAVALLAIVLRRGNPAAGIEAGPGSMVELLGSRAGGIPESREAVAASVRGCGSVRLRHFVLAGLCVGPLVLAWLASIVVQPVYMVGRYDLVAWPAFAVWLGVLTADAWPKRGDSSSVRPQPAGASLVLLMLCSVIPLARMDGLRPGPSFPRVRATRLSELARGEDFILAFSYDRDYLLYYLYRSGCSAALGAFPTWIEDQVGWVDTTSDTSPARQPLLEEDAGACLARIRAVLQMGGRVWLLSDSLDPTGEGPRGPVNSVLLKRLAQAGLRIDGVDERLGIFQVAE